MWAAIVIIVVALLLVLAAPKPKIENARAANLGDFQFPRSKEGDPVPWFLGTVRLKSPNSLWFGDYTPVPIKKKQKTGLFSSKKVTVGYKYHIGLDLCWALGGNNPVTLRKLWSDKHVFWSGNINTAQTLAINLPNLFGGQEERGGLVGNIDFYPGRFTETRNSYLAQKADPDVPAYIGQARLVFRGNPQPAFWGKLPPGATEASGFYFGTTTNINAISAEMSRYSSNVHATYSIMPNGLDVNPMELLHAGFTERFGMPGVSTADIDLPSWQVCAETLYNEGLGMSLLVQQSITGKDLCEEVMRIADGILYQDTDSGKMVAVLIRDNYDVETLPVLDQSIIKDLVNFSKTTWDQTYNQCRVTFKDRSNDYSDRAATAQDFANINFQNRVKNTDISVPGCFVNDAANQLAVRQLSLLSVPLFQIEIRCNRKANSLRPGDVFIFEWAPYGISNMVMRVQKIDKGTLVDGVITINAVQDRFATALAVFAPPTGTGWTPISNAAAPVATRKIVEVPYWFSRFATTPPATGQGLIMTLAAPPSSASVEFDVDITTNADSTWTNPLRALEDAPYYGTGVLTAPYADTVARASGYDATGFTLELVDLPSSLIDLDSSAFDSAGQMLLLIGNEIMSAGNIIDNGNGTYTFQHIRRALLDSDFESHALGARCYFIQQADNLLEGYFADNATWRLRLLDSTPTSTLDPASANVDVFTMTQRMFRPAPPDYVTINSSRTPTSVIVGSTLNVAWRARNRLNSNLVEYNAGSDTQEAGVDYGYRTRVNGGAWSGYTYTSSLSASIPAGTVSGTFEVEVVSRRDGLLSRVGDRCSITIDPGTIYRIDVTATNTADTFFFNLSEIVMRATVGGANIATGGAASASTEHPANPASLAFDGNNATMYSSADGAGTPQWIQYAIPSAAATVVEMVLTSGDTAARAARAPKDFTIKRSTDGGASFTTVKTVVGAPAWGITESRTYSIP